MPNLTVQPDSRRPIPRKEALKYCIIATEFIGGGGVRAEAYVEFDGTAYAAGQKFTFAGVEFTTTSTTISHNTFPIVADAQTSAENMRDALALNVKFFGVTAVFLDNPSLGVWRCRVRWIEAGPVEDWDFDYSLLSPEPAHAETAGVETDTTEGMKLRYQLWGQRGDDLIPITNVESVTPRAYWFGTPRICFDFRDDVKGLVAPTFPGFGATGMTLDETFSLTVFLKYGVYQVLESGPIQFNWISSNECTLLASVVQIDDVQKLIPHNYNDTYPVALLTARPSALRVPSSAYLWLWVYAIHMDSAIFTAMRINYKYYDAAGAYLTQSNSASVTVNGVFYFPAGPANSPGIPDTAKKIEITMQVFRDDGSDTWENGSETHTVLLCDNCPKEEFYFIEDMGGFGTMHFDEVEEIIHVVENQVFYMGEETEDDLYNSNLSDRTQTRGFTRANIRSRNLYRASVNYLDTPELERWYRQFNDSEEIFHRYISATGDEIVRKIVLDPNETTIRKDGEYLTLEIAFRYHTDLR